MIAASERLGFNARCSKMSIGDIKDNICRGIPVILMIQGRSDDTSTDWRNEWSKGHYVVAVGYDDKRLYFNDPRPPARTSLTIRQLHARWHDSTDAGKKYVNYGIVITNPSSRRTLAVNSATR
jgi:uncharacterized protein YvpB